MQEEKPDSNVWVHVIDGVGFLLARGIEKAYRDSRERASQDGYLIQSVTQACTSTAHGAITCILTFHVVSVEALERMQRQQRLGGISRN